MASDIPQGPATKTRSPANATPAKTADNDAECPERAIFVRRFGEIRGYPLDANGETVPCTIVSGPQSNLSVGLPYGDIAISQNGFIHALSFQANDTRVLTIDAPDASGNALPRRLVGVSPDAVALAVDSNVTDYVVAGENYQGDSCWYIVPNSSTIAKSSNCDANLSAITALAVDTHGNLIAAGPDALTGAARLDVISNPSKASFAVARSIEGSENGIGPSATIALAVAPRSGELYVFSRSLGSPAIVNVFSDGASGNPEPSRTIIGSNADLPQSAFAVNVLAVDDAGFLYVTNVTGKVFVYGPSASGNAFPVREITDSSAKHTIAAGIALRL